MQRDSGASRSSPSHYFISDRQASPSLRYTVVGSGARCCNLQRSRCIQILATSQGFRYESVDPHTLGIRSIPCRCTWYDHRVCFCRPESNHLLLPGCQPTESQLVWMTSVRNTTSLKNVSERRLFFQKCTTDVRSGVQWVRKWALIEHLATPSASNRAGIYVTPFHQMLYHHSWLQCHSASGQVRDQGRRATVSVESVSGVPAQHVKFENGTLKTVGSGIRSLSP